MNQEGLHIRKPHLPDNSKGAQASVHRSPHYVKSVRADSSTRRLCNHAHLECHQQAGSSRAVKDSCRTSAWVVDSIQSPTDGQGEHATIAHAPTLRLDPWNANMRATSTYTPEP